ncbi:MAG: hypothetical protein IGR93_15360 [Hydrococcus sp. C42_A2020_068]|nr:hypothetical protein [Hydrococcus sp. C42_A2020_068]
MIIAGQKGEINYGTRMYRRVQSTIRLLRRGKSLEQATALSGIPTSVIERLIVWGQNRRAASQAEVVTSPVTRE